MKNKTVLFLIAHFTSILTTMLFLIPYTADAHENYVLTKDQIAYDITTKTPAIWNSLASSDNLKVAITVAIFSCFGVIVYFLFSLSSWGEKFSNILLKADGIGHIILRFALGISFLASAYFNSFLGPEISLNSMPLSIVFRILLYILGAILILGMWSELTGAVSLILLIITTFYYKEYMLTYFNYFGEFISLILFGSSIFSLDKLFKRNKKNSVTLHNWETAIIRVTYGVSVIYPAITYKLAHPQIIVDIVTRYNLTQFHWLFPHDPLLISLGTGLTQIAVGTCLIIGFETRLNSFVTFILMTMSVLFFKEAVWPHYILLALALYLIFNNGGGFSLDSYIAKHKIKIRHWFLKTIL